MTPAPTRSSPPLAAVTSTPNAAGSVGPVSAAANDDDEPISKVKLGLVALVVINEAISMAMLFPYIGLLIVRVQPGMSKRDAGNLSGIITGSFQVAQALFASRIGRLSDGVGRRPILAFGLVASAIMSLCFGVSSTVWQLILFRFLYGAANGNAPLAKVMIAEMTTAKTDAFGWSTMSAGWAGGAALGPTLGGLLYDPCAHMPSRFCGTAFETHPALLPAIVSSGYAMFALFIVLKFLPETNKKANPPSWLQAFGFPRGPLAPVPVQDTEEMITLTTTDGLGRGGDKDVVATNEQDKTNTAMAAPPPATSIAVPVAAAAAVPSPQPAAPYGLKQMLLDRRMSRILFGYVMIAWINTTFGEVFPLLSILPVHQGGLGVDSAVIGIMFMIFAVENICSTALFPKLTATVGRLRLMRISLCVVSFFTAAFGALPSVDWHGNAGHIILAASLLSVLRVAGTMFTFSVSTMGIAAAAPPDHLGVATGISHSLGNVARAVMPALGTIIFAWSVGHDDAVAIADAATPAPSAATSSPMASSTAASSAMAVDDGPPQSFFGPHFPFNRWFVFLVLPAAMLLTAAATKGLKETDYIRATNRPRPDDSPEDSGEEAEPATATDKTEGLPAAGNELHEAAVISIDDQQLQQAPSRERDANSADVVNGVPMVDTAEAVPVKNASLVAAPPPAVTAIET